MTTFKYKGVSKDGVELNGIIRAYDELEAVSKLRENCSIITNIEVVPDSDKTGTTEKFKIKEKELALICSQFSIILKAGMPIVRCVEMIADQSASKELRARMLKVADDVSGGHTLAQSFEDNMPGLPATFVQTVRAGERSGTLENCFDRLHKYYDKSAKVRGKVAGALIYPAIVITVAIVVLIIIMTVAVPMFKDTFEGMGTELPGITKGLMAVSDFFVNYWWVLVVLAAIVAVIYLTAGRSESGKIKMAEFALKKSPLHKINAMNCASQFSATMSTMIAAGLPIVESLDVTSNVITNYVFSKAIAGVKTEVEQGKTIKESMQARDCFPKLLTEMCGVGEQAGSMEETLDVIGDFYSNEVTLATDKLMAAMEPAITVGLAVITVVLLLAVYLPMFSMYGSV